MLFVSVAPESVGVAAATLVGPPLIGNGADRPPAPDKPAGSCGATAVFAQSQEWSFERNDGRCCAIQRLRTTGTKPPGHQTAIGNAETTCRARHAVAIPEPSRSGRRTGPGNLGEVATARARRTVHTYICNLRRTLSDAGVDSRNILVSEPPGYRLLIGDRQQCDLDRFVAAKESGLRASAKGYFSEAIRYLDSALQNWRGPVLGDLRSFMFVQMFSRALTEDELLVHTKLAEAAIACGRADVVIPKLERLVAMHPYRESLWKQLMLGYYVNEYQSAAIDAYHRLKSTLAEELGVEPAPTIRALYHKILRQLPMDDLVGRVTRGRVDLRGGNGAKVEELTESDKDLLPIGLA